MNAHDKQKLHAGKKIVAGGAEILSGVLTSLGYGFDGKCKPSVLKTNTGAAEVKDGVKHLKQGLNEWNS
jgi:hypothetical protein